MGPGWTSWAWYFLNPALYIIHDSWHLLSLFLMYFGGLYWKQYVPRSDCPLRNSLILVLCVCFYDELACSALESCTDPESFARGGSALTTFFFPDNEGERIQIPLKLGHHRAASETPFKWCFAGGPIMA